MTPDEHREYLRTTLADHHSFSKILPGFQRVWDATCLSLFQRCPRRYYYEMIEGYAPGSRIDLEFGIIYHKALEQYTLDRHEGKSHDEAVANSVQLALLLSGARDENGVWQPWPDDFVTTNKNRRTLVRTIVWYLETWQEDPTELLHLATGAPAVELPFLIELNETMPLSGESIAICGTVDRRVRYAEAVFELDHKTTKTTVDARYFERYTPSNQVSLYTFADKAIYSEPCRGMIIDAAQIAVGFSRFMRMEILRTQGMLDEWYADTLFWIRTAERCAEELHWPLNPESCWSCPFHKRVCRKDPSVRSIYLREMPRRRWDPAARSLRKERAE